MSVPKDIAAFRTAIEKALPKGYVSTCSNGSVEPPKDPAKRWVKQIIFKNTIMLHLWPTRTLIFLVVYGAKQWIADAVANIHSKKGTPKVYLSDVKRKELGNDQIAEKLRMAMAGELDPTKINSRKPGVSIITDMVLIEALGIFSRADCTIPRGLVTKDDVSAWVGTNRTDFSFKKVWAKAQRIVKVRDEEEAKDFDIFS